MTAKSWLYDHFIAKRYGRELGEITDGFRRLCIDGAGVREGQTVLDLGCGTGLNQPILREAIGPGGKIIGVDASREMLKQAADRANAGGYSGQLDLIHGDLRQLRTLVPEPVDAVIATLIFSVVPDWRDVFAQSFERLKAGGRYGIMDNYWPRAPFRLWLLSWTFAADAKRPGFEPLEQSVDDFVLEYHPPDADVQFYIAHGTKAAN